jgi:hypothetical protein
MNQQSQEIGGVRPHSFRALLFLFILIEYKNANPVRQLLALNA